LLAQTVFAPATPVVSSLLEFFILQLSSKKQTLISYGAELGAE
jgi:hypothetical protein